MKNEKLLTRATFRLMALVLCLAAAIPQLHADVTIFVRGTAPYLYVFNTNGTAPTDGSAGNYPGVKMTQSTTSSDGTTWYYVNYVGLNSCSIIFSNGSGGNSNQTWNITNVNGTKYYYSNGSNYYLDLTIAKDKAGYVFFEDTNNWGGTLRAHCWNGNYSTQWPGDVMEFVGGTNGGRSVYAWTNARYTPGMIIFTNKNDGSQQTADLTYHNGYYYYNNGNSTNSNYANLSFPTLPVVVNDTYVVAGPSSIFGSNWDGTSSANTMDEGSNGNYTLTLNNVSLTASTDYEYKVVKNGSQWIPSGDNLKFSVPLNGTYNITFTFNPTTSTCEVTCSLQTATGGETYTVAGSNTTILGSSWDQTDSNNDMTLANGVYQLTFNDVVFSDNNPSCEFRVVVNHSWVTAYPSGNASVSGFNGSGTYDIVFTYDPSDNSVTGVATKQVIYYVVGDEDLIGHDWAIANDAAMINNSWTKTGIHLNMGTYSLKVKDSDGNWYGDSNGNNVTVTASENGTYDLTVTRDASTGVVSATLTRTASDANQTYNIYVRYTGNEVPSNVYLHAWNAVTDYNQWPGIQFSTMTTQVINGHTYYKYTITNTTATSIGLQFNENGSSSTQTGNLTAQPGNSYFTYGGGSTVDGPNAQPDEPTPTYDYTIYVRYKGSATPYMHLWNGSGDQLGSFPGTALTDANTFSTETINGYTYYKYVVSASNYSTMGMILSEGSDENKTSDLTVNPGTSYWTYGGGNTVYGPNAQADPAITTYYAATEIYSWTLDAGSLMTYNSDDGSYSKTFTGISLTAGTNYGYKVFGANDGTNEGVWIGDSQGNNATFSPAVSGTYDVTITLNSDGTISHTLTLTQAAPIYIEGSAGLGLSWGHAPTTTMTYDQSTGWYTYTCNVAEDGTYSFFFANGQSDEWDYFNSHYRIGPQSGDQAIAIDGNWVTTQMAGTDGGAYQINVAAGPVTIHFNPATTPMQFKVEATAPSYQYTFYIYPSDGTTTPHIYLWDNAQNVYTNAFPGNVVTATETLDDGKTWYKYSEVILVDVLNAIISAGGDNANDTKTKDITNFEPGTYYIVWNPDRPIGESYNHFELYNDPPSAIGAHKLFIHGGYYHEGQTFSYSSDTGSEMKYDGNTGNYYINNITLSSNATFCFTTELSELSEDWDQVGVRYGNGGTAYTENPGGTNYLEVTPSMINTNMPLNEWSPIYGEYKMATAGVFNILVNPTQHWVKLIKTDHKNLSPMNVYLEQTDNVKINNIQEPGTTYNTSMFDGYWPLSAYNQEQGGWDPNSDSQHYPVTYIGDTTTVDGKHWWHWQVSASIAEVFFTRTNKSPYQSEAIVRHAGVLWYTWDEINGQTVMTDHTREYFEAAANALPTNAVVMEGHYYVYFINTLGWDKVFCYAWDEADGQYTDGYNRVMESWPGHICELVGIDPVTGYEVWRYDLGTISSIDKEPDGILFNDGDTNALSDSKEQTGDFEYINGGVFDYLGLFDGAYTLNNLIRTAAEEVRYTVSNDLLAVFYDPKAVTTIHYTNKYGEPVSEDITGALYAKDLNQYGEKSAKPDASFTDYVYQTCASNHTPGGSQVMIKKTTYDQSNWVKLVMSPNYDGRNPVPVAANQRPDLGQYVGRIIPAGTLDVFMTDTINPTAHVLSIQMGEEMSYEPNVYISSHFNDTVVFNYTHKDWQLGTYNGNYRTQPHITWNFTYNEQGDITGVSGDVERELVVADPYYMYYVAPKPQEIAYITWMVYDNYNTPRSGEDPAVWPNYDPNNYQPYTAPNPSSIPPIDPGRFYAPMNWNRSIEIPGEAYESLQYLGGNELDAALGAWVSDYGPYSNGYMQYGAVKVNWSLFQEDTPWWHIFKPGQAYKFLAIIRYARGSGEDNSTSNYYYGPSIGNYVVDEDHQYSDNGAVFNAPRRDNDELSGFANMYHSSYDHLDESKFIIFPIKASAMRSNGDGMGNVTSVKEVISDVTSYSRTVVGVSYYNLMGVKSDKPFDGINIVVTTYSDGSRTSKKILR